MNITFSDPFYAEGQWFKGNLHAHTTNSDGLLTPRQLISRYRDGGYDFLSITDHGKRTDTSSLSGEDLLVIPGEEICVGTSQAGRLFHVVGVGIEEELPLEDADRDASPQEAIDLIRGLGGIAFIGHPYWSELNHADLAGLTGHLGIEVYNTTCDLSIGRGFSGVHWDSLLTRGRRPMGFAVDDTHSKELELLPSDSCRAWINVKAASLEADKILDSVRRGLYYSSIGPEIRSINVADGEIEVSCSPARSIAFISNRSLGRKYTEGEGNLESAVYSLKGSERYIRIEVSDRIGRIAWSNPIYIEG